MIYSHSYYIPRFDLYPDYGAYFYQTAVELLAHNAQPCTVAVIPGTWFTTTRVDSDNPQTIAASRLRIEREIQKEPFSFTLGLTSALTISPTWVPDHLVEGRDYIVHAEAADINFVFVAFHRNSHRQGFIEALPEEVPTSLMCRSVPYRNLLAPVAGGMT